MVQEKREPTLVLAEDTAFVFINGVVKSGVSTLSLASITDGINSCTLGDDDMKVGDIGGCIVVMRAFELPPR
jgi:hypothetical protein